MASSNPIPVAIHDRPEYAIPLVLARVDPSVEGGGHVAVFYGDLFLEYDVELGAAAV